MALARYLCCSPSKFFKKNNITFLIIRRYDLSDVQEKLHYISVKPNASTSMLRQKIWHLLDLPDFCEEGIVLKNGSEQVPLTAMCSGNTLQNPLTLEVWPPKKHFKDHKNMLTMGDEHVSGDNDNSTIIETTTKEDVHELRKQFSNDYNMSSLNKDKYNKLSNPLKSSMNFMTAHNKKSEMTTCRLSSTSLIFRLPGKKHKDQLTNILLQMQGELNMLTQKISVLENSFKV